MRGLNLLQNKLFGAGKTRWKTSWARHQYAALEGISGNLRPVFPGSMLFNHILVPVEQSNYAVQIPHLVPDTRDVEFAFLSRRSIDNRLKNTVLVDFDGAAEHLPINAIKNLIQDRSPVDRIAVLDGFPQQTFDDLLDGPGTKLLAIKPDWKSIHEMHALYRDARQVIFVDTMRVLDAAYCGCNALLIATERFRCDPAFDLLLRQLDRVECVAYSDNSEPLLPMQKSYNFAVVENSMDHLTRQLAGEKHADWLDYFTRIDTTVDDHVASLKPVITSPERLAGGVWSNVLDRRTRFMRKANKLRQDPRSFLSDSNHTLLKRMSRVLPKRKAG